MHDRPGGRRRLGHALTSNPWSVPALQARLDEAVTSGALPNLHGLVVIREGELALEWYGVGDDDSWGRPLGHVTFDPETLHDLRSVTKSIVGLLYGIALDRGAVPAPDEHLLRSFPDYVDLAADPARSRLRIEHVLTMTMGTAWDESLPYTNSANSEIAMELAAVRYRFILDRPMISEPGAKWGYNGGATALLGRLIAKGTGRSLPEFAHEALFAPLGITAFEWAGGSDGEPSAASGLRLRPRDLARIGQLILQHGTWEERTVVPAEWLHSVLQERAVIDGARSYGYHWYLGRLPTQPALEWIGAMGNGGQRLWVVPALDLVVATTFGNYDRPDQRSAPDRVFAEVTSRLI